MKDLKGELGRLTAMTMDELFELHKKAIDKCVGVCASVNIICDREKAPKMTVLDINNKLCTIPIGEIRINAMRATIHLCPQWRNLIGSVSDNLLKSYDIEKCYSSAYENIVLSIYDYVKWHLEKEKEND